MKPRILVLLLSALLPACAAPTVLNGQSPALTRLNLRDSELKSKITGVWFGEELPNLTMHVASRTQYFPDNRFIADYRVSHIGGDKFISEAGFWDVTMGVFTETVQQSTRSGTPTPKLIRRVLSIDDQKMTLESRTGMRATLIRGRVPLERGAPSIEARNHREFMQQLEAMGMRGFLPEPIEHKGKTYNAWRLESQKLPKPPL